MIPSYLEGFSKRMTLVAEISSVIARINKNSELEALIGFLCSYSYYGENSNGECQMHAR